MKVPVIIQALTKETNSPNLRDTLNCETWNNSQLKSFSTCLPQSRHLSLVPLQFPITIYMEPEDVIYLTFTLTVNPHIFQHMSA